MKILIIRFFLLLILSLQVNVAWVMDSAEQRDAKPKQSITEAAEILKVYTHSHSSDSSNIKALYIKIKYKA